MSTALELPRLAVGIMLSAAIALVAHRARTLSASGACAAWVVGALAFAAGWTWVLALLAFFVSSSALSRWRRAAKERATHRVVEKGGTRDAWQVAANGGVFAAAAAASIGWPHDAWAIAGLGALAAATADTWATEVGTAVGGAPRTVLGWTQVPRGTSGAMTLAGSAAMVAGGGFIGTIAALAQLPTGGGTAVAAGGVVGALVDTLAGATIQERRWCVRCESATERGVHDCGATTVRRGGIPSMTNDAINLTSCLAGALAAFAWWRVAG